MKPLTVTAAKFKAQCLALLDLVATTGRPLVVTRRGEPLARIVPVKQPRRSLRNSIIEETDIVGPTGERLPSA